MRRWWLKRQFRPMAKGMGFTSVEEFEFGLNLRDECRRCIQGDMPPHEIAELKEIISRPSTQEIIAKVKKIGAWDVPDI